MKDEAKLLGCILELGSLMLQNGSETAKTEERLYKLCDAYGFVHTDCFIIPTNIQLSVETTDGRIITQVCHVRKTGVNFMLLDRVHKVYHYALENTPSAAIFHDRLNRAKVYPAQPLYVTALASFVSGGSFTVLFGGNVWDFFVGGFLAMFIGVGGTFYGKIEKNLFMYNMVFAFLCETAILFLARNFSCFTPSSVTTGVVMMLISALATTNGVRDLLHRDYISGVENIIISVLGAGGIATGITFSMLAFHSGSSITISEHGFFISLLSCSIGAIGFVIWFEVPKDKITAACINVIGCWSIYAILFYLLGVSDFFSTLISAVFVAVYARVVANHYHCPSTIFLTTGILPVIPGATLYQLLFAVTTNDPVLIREKGHSLAYACIAIALGFLTSYLKPYIRRG
ncbi:MAG: threonine/serine exporter family protein [Lachnospiraceae bacterium]|nr:threonine/serine exporter family protein [Lachnospiraceae bacterium]